MQKTEITRRLSSVIKSLKKDIADASDLSDIYKVRAKFTGKDSEIVSLLSEIPNLPVEDRSSTGSEINIAKKEIHKIINDAIFVLENAEALRLDQERDIDISAPFAVGQPDVARLPSIGALHPTQFEINRLLDIFRTMGFTPFEARELDTDYYVFDAVNMPPNHPARDNWDTFRTEEKYIPTPHTTNMQVRIMRHLKKTPLRAIMYGKCFRNEAIDAVHSHTFYQVEGLYIDKGVTIGNMIGTIKAFVEAFYDDSNMEWRIQPAFFPFTEPSIEFLVKCPFCKGEGCSSCKHTKWLEVLGAGMIHPHVLREGGFDPSVYSGFAWGLGLDRMVMQRSNIRDIRSLFSSDLRFLTTEV